MTCAAGHWWQMVAAHARLASATTCVLVRAVITKLTALSVQTFARTPSGLVAASATAAWLSFNNPGKPACSLPCKPMGDACPFQLDRKTGTRFLRRQPLAKSKLLAQLS